MVLLLLLSPSDTELSWLVQEKLGALQKASKLIEALLSDEALLERAGPLQRAHCLLTHALSLLARSRKKVSSSSPSPCSLLIIYIFRSRTSGFVMSVQFGLSRPGRW